MGGMDPLEVIVELADRQHGVVARRQLETSVPPVSRSALRHAERRGRVDRLSARVLRVRGAPRTPHQRAMAAALDVERGCVALQSALALWGVPGYHLTPVHVLTTREPHRGSDRIGIVHSTTSLAEADVGLVDGIPVTVPARRGVAPARPRRRPDATGPPACARPHRLTPAGSPAVAGATTFEPAEG
jgi:predicted transcriptional regulator of viral defense system